MCFLHGKLPLLLFVYTIELEIRTHKSLPHLFWVHMCRHSRVPSSSAHAKVHLVQIVK